MRLGECALSLTVDTEHTSTLIIVAAAAFAASVEVVLDGSRPGIHSSDKKANVVPTLLAAYASGNACAT